jgi:hypothetical protein
MDAPRPPFAACDRKQPYLFVSYAHRDSSIVYPDIQQFHDQGYRVWYDEGIEPGSEWPEDVANALNDCDMCLLYLSPQAVDSRNVRNEIHLAISKNKPIITVHIEETQLPSGLELQLGSTQAILRHSESEEQYRRRIEKAFTPYEQLRGATVATIDRVSTEARPWKKIGAILVAIALLLIPAVHYGVPAVMNRLDATPISIDSPTNIASEINATPDTVQPNRVIPDAVELPPQVTTQRQAPAIPAGGIVCASGPVGSHLSRAVSRKITEQGVRTRSTTTEKCDETISSLLQSGRLPSQITQSPKARVYIAIDTWIAVEDSTFWMSSAGGEIVVAVINEQGVEVQSYPLTTGQTGVQPNERMAMQALRTDLIQVNTDILAEIGAVVQDAHRGVR